MDIQWKDGKMEQVRIVSHLGGNLRIRTASELVLEGGKALEKAEGSNLNPYYAVPVVKAPLVSRSADLVIEPVGETFLYDLPTAAGKEYFLMAI
jgi:alpha-L-fucosidase 2